LFQRADRCCQNSTFTLDDIHYDLVHSAAPQALLASRCRACLASVVSSRFHSSDSPNSRSFGLLTHLKILAHSRKVISSWRYKIRQRGSPLRLLRRHGGGRFCFRRYRKLTQYLASTKVIANITRLLAAIAFSRSFLMRFSGCKERIPNLRLGCNQPFPV
jgi:hypothetical protein